MFLPDNTRLGTAPEGQDRTLAPGKCWSTPSAGLLGLEGSTG